MHMLCKTKHVDTKSVRSSNARPRYSKEFAICLWASRMHVRRTCVWNFRPSSNDISPVKNCLCGPWKKPTFKAYTGTPHRQSKHKVRACQLRSNGRLRSDPRGWHRASNPPSLYQNPKTNISLTSHPAKKLNGILCGCSNLEHAVGVQRWVYASHPQSLPRRKSGASLGILVHIFP